MFVAEIFTKVRLYFYWGQFIADFRQRFILEYQLFVLNTFLCWNATFCVYYNFTKIPIKTKSRHIWILLIYFLCFVLYMLQKRGLTVYRLFRSISFQKFSLRNLTQIWLIYYCRYNTRNIFQSIWRLFFMIFKCFNICFFRTQLIVICIKSIRSLIPIVLHLYQMTSFF